MRNSTLDISGVHLESCYNVWIHHRTIWNMAAISNLCFFLLIPAICEFTIEREIVYTVYNSLDLPQIGEWCYLRCGTNKAQNGPAVN